ncbi:NAT10, partial [Paramicrosporidium saccamoebae]
MVKKKIDQRIRTLIENGVQTRHRSLFIMVGDHGANQVANLHYILSKAQVARRPSVLWCYKKELNLSSNKKKRMKQMKQKKQLGLLDAARIEEDPFELFLSSTDIRYTFYHETDKILGNTFGMCVLQDFEALTPNLLARTIETVQGGGVVILLLQTLTSLKQLYTMSMDVHSRYRTEGHSDAVARFNERFLLSLTGCESCLVVDDQLNVLPISTTCNEIVPINKETIEGIKTPEEVELEKLKTALAADGKSNTKLNAVSSLTNLAKTLDQAKVVQSVVGILADQNHTLRTTVSLTAARGRGKSAALGLSLAAAVSAGYGNIF